jgi:hypothetical protein
MKYSHDTFLEKKIIRKKKFFEGNGIDWGEG